MWEFVGIVSRRRPMANMPRLTWRIIPGPCQWIATLLDWMGRLREWRLHGPAWQRATLTGVLFGAAVVYELGHGCCWLSFVLAVGGCLLYALGMWWFVLRRGDRTRSD